MPASANPLLFVSCLSLFLAAESLCYFLRSPARHLLGRVLGTSPFVGFLSFALFGFAGRRKSKMIVPSPPPTAPAAELTVDAVANPQTVTVSDDLSWMGMVICEVLRFREALGLSSRNGLVALNELLLETLEDLKNKYPKYSACIQLSEVNYECLHQGLLHFNEVLKSIGDSWSENFNHSTSSSVQEINPKTLSMHQLAERALQMLNYLVSQSSEMFNHVEMVSSNVSMPENQQSKSLFLSSPHTPTSVLPEMPKRYIKPDSNVAYFPHLRPLKLQAVKKLHPIDAKHLSFHMFPLALDDSPHPASQTDQTVDDQRLDSPGVFRNADPNKSSLTEKYGLMDDISGLAEPTSLGSALTTPRLCSALTTPRLCPKKAEPGSTTACPPSTPRSVPLKELLMPSLSHFQRVHMEPFSQSMNLNNSDGDSRKSSSEDTFFSMPMHKLGASEIQSQTLNPSSPMILTGVFMPFSPSGHAQFSMEHPFAYAMTVSDSDNSEEWKPSECTLVESQPSEWMLRLKSPLGQLEFPSLPVISLSKSPLAQSQSSLPPPLPVSPTAAQHPPPAPQLPSNGLVPSPSPSLPPNISVPSVPAPVPSTPMGAMPFTHALQPPCQQPGTSPRFTSPPLPPTPISSFGPPLPPESPGITALLGLPLPTLAPEAPHCSGPPPPPPTPGASTPSYIAPTLPQEYSAPCAPPPLVPARGSVPPPPPPAMRTLRAKVSKLKRSSQMGNLYRLLKRKLEGSNLPGKVSNRQKSKTCSSDGKKSGQGMADALAEMTKRSSYFQQIEEDFQKYYSEILELKCTISNFRTKDMTELQIVCQNVEKHLEKLTDETQVLTRFEEFPHKKLESIRTAVALNRKLDGMITTLKTWKMVHPVAKQLDKIEIYFSKIKEEVDAIERTKDEESKRFQSNNIEFDFGILLRIKEVMVDLSSNCIEMALKESRDANEGGMDVNSKSNAQLSKLLWRAFQLSFRVYNFAGGQDERADRLTSELAREIETYSRT